MACCRITLLRLKPYMFEPSDDDSLRVKQPLASFLAKFKRSEVRADPDAVNLQEVGGGALAKPECESQTQGAAHYFATLYSWLTLSCQKQGIYLLSPACMTASQ